jgi:hypothetical protein
VRRGEYTPTVASGHNFSVSIDILNSGWAWLHKPRDARLMLRTRATTHVYDLSNGGHQKLATGDPNPALGHGGAPPAQTFEVRLAIPAPDVPAPDAPQRIPYAVKLTSSRNGVNVFDENTGENNLGMSTTV